jgi:hypothetical protein
MATENNIAMQAIVRVGAWEGCVLTTSFTRRLRTMYGLSADTDLSFFADKLLGQVCIGYSEAILCFGDDVSITIQTDISHVSSAGEGTAVYKTIRPSAPMFVALLHCSVVRASALPPGTLVLEFSYRERLEIHDSTSQYESYLITHGEKVIVV